MTNIPFQLGMTWNLWSF